MKIDNIATIKNDYKEKFGIPRQSGLVKSLISEIHFEPEYRDVNAVRGIEEYSHLWLLWLFSENEGKGWSPTVRPPRLGGNVRKGVFATRSPFRPNPIGLSCVDLDRVEYREEGPVLIVRGADLMDGTPIVDIKPYVPYTDSRENASSSFAGEVFDYKMKVEIPEHLLKVIPEKSKETIIEVLAQDPRPGYQSDPDRIYGMEYGSLNVKFRAEEDRIILVDIERKHHV